MKIFFNLVLVLILFPFYLFGQNTWTNNELNMLNEQSVSSDSNFHFTIKPYTVKDFDNFEHVNNVNAKSKVIDKLINENLLEVKKDNYKIAINPILHSQYFYYSEDKKIFSDNRIGLNVFAKIKDKFYFTSDIFYSNRILPLSGVYYGKTSVFIPHYGTALKNTNNSYNILSFTGELSFHPTKNIFFHVGRGKHFLGNGYRSLFLSDNSNAYPYIKTTIDIWKIKYVWMATKLKDVELSNSLLSSEDLYNKATFIHYFSLNVTKRININFFETIITNPYDHNGNRTGYDAGYYNPVIFFRPVEFYSGTSDNSMIGLGANVRLFKSLHLYSQFILDDLVMSRLNDDSGWWGNKFGVQAGLKAYNLLNVKGLFFRGEVNIVKPYTYSHGTSKNGISNLNYGHYRQKLAHPMGANFVEAISEINYNKGRYIASAKIILSKKGIDKDTISYGGDIYSSYNLRPSDLGITFLQGEISKFAFADFNVSYLINPNYNLKLKLGAYYRKISNNVTNIDDTVIYFGLSTNLFNEANDF